MEQEKPKKKSSWSWKIDEADLNDQIKNYDTLNITQSFRGISVLIISALLGLSLLLSFFGVYDLITVFWGIIIYLPIVFFVYKGHRWAIIALMALWTLEKGYQIYEIGENGSGGGIMPIIWWFIVMPYFWKALKVENGRRKLDKLGQSTQTSSIFCSHCGNAIEGDSKFCVHCGKNINPIF